MRRLTVVVALVLSLGAASCAPLPPWQRGLLVSQAMKDPGDPGADAFETHVRSIHELSTGAGGTGGVSCGCN